MTVMRIDFFFGDLSIGELAAEKINIADRHHLTGVRYLGRRPSVGMFAFMYRFEGTQLEQCEGCEEWFPTLNEDVLDKFSLCDPCKEREEILQYEPDPDAAYEMRVDDQMGVG